MNITNPKQRARALKKILTKIYDPYGEHTNVIDVLADLRHLCDRYGYDFAQLDRTAYRHYLDEKSTGSIDCEQPNLTLKKG